MLDNAAHIIKDAIAIAEKTVANLEEKFEESGYLDSYIAEEITYEKGRLDALNGVYRTVTYYAKEIK